MFGVSAYSPWHCPLLVDRQQELRPRLLSAGCRRLSGELAELVAFLTAPLDTVDNKVHVGSTNDIATQVAERGDRRHPRCGLPLRSDPVRVGEKPQQSFGPCTASYRARAGPYLRLGSGCRSGWTRYPRVSGP